MRHLTAFKSKALSWQSSCISNRQPSPHRSSVTSNRGAYRFLVASPHKAHWKSLKSRGGQVKGLRALSSEVEGLQTSADLQVFTNWLIESGVEGISGNTEKVEIFQYGEDGRGLRATTDIEDGDVICSIPLELVLAHKSDEEDFVAQLGENLDEFTALAVKLLRERAQQEHSRYHPHIQVLPTSVPSLYGGFPESCKEELQGFVSDPDWEEGRNRTAFEYAKIAQSPLMTGLTEDDFRWAYSVVSSRAFAGAFEAQDGTKVVWKFCAPLLDMLDHGGTCQLPGEEPVRLDNVRWGMQDVGSSACRVQAFATQSISRGQPLLLRYIDGFPSTHYLLHYGFVPVLDPDVEVDLFPHMYGAVNWTMDRLYPEKDGMGEKERQQLAAEAHRAAREAGLKDIMAANESGGVTRDSLRKANPLAVKLNSRNAYLDHRFVQAVSVLVQPLQGSFKEKRKLVNLILLERIDELLTQPGRTSLDADLQFLARHAAPADRSLYAKCLQMYRAIASALRGLQRPTSRFVQDYECPVNVAEEMAHLSTCKLQAIQLRANQKMAFLDALWSLVLAAERTSESRKAPPKSKARSKAGSNSSAAKGFGAGAAKVKRLLDSLIQYSCSFGSRKLPEGMVQKGPSRLVHESPARGPLAIFMRFWAGKRCLLH